MTLLVTTNEVYEATYTSLLGYQFLRMNLHRLKPLQQLPITYFTLALL